MPWTPPYIELHCHSGYSFLDGASHPEELVLRARELGYPALALTDHNGLYGSMEFARFAREHGVQAITGAEVTLVDGSHLTLLAETPAGYANLCRLLSRTHLESPRDDPRLPLQALLDRPEGLIVLTGCREGALLRHLESSVADAETLARRLLDVLGPRHLFVELQDNSVKGDGARYRTLGRLADRLGIPVVGTGNVHYHRPERHRLQDVLVAIRNRATLDGSHDMRRPNGTFYLASPGEMAHRFRSRPDALRNTLLIAQRASAFDLTRDLGYTFPDFQGSERGSAPRILWEICHAHLDQKYPPGCKRRDEALCRLEEELRLVERHGLSGFFLVYRDIMEMAVEMGARVRGNAPRATSGLPPGRGRGSSVSSIICYLIGLSHIDPVETNLFLGRFLNEAMGSVPDIDLDFPRDIREALILEVYNRYGNDHAGLVCTFPTYRLRSTVREVGKALDLPQGDLEKLAKLADRSSASGLGEELERLPEFKDRAHGPLWQALAERSAEIAGLPRHVSQHVGGMIISSRPLIEIVPLEPAAMDGRVLCQWDKDSCDDAGFIKIDFLALGMLSLVEEAVDSIAVRHGAAPDLSRIDFQDEAVYDRICAGDTVGMFQVESRAQIQMLRRTRPRDLEQLAIQVAIVRPGPIVGGAVNPYVRRREMLREDPDYRVQYDHPLLEEALGETLGVIIYQDQVLLVCKALAGFSDGQAEGLRRAMSRKRSSEAMEGYRQAFLEGAGRNGVDPLTAEKVFQQVVAFSAFGFPKSHAAAFGLLAYQSAWLRLYYPTEYYVGLFNNQPMGFYGLDALARDARRHNVDTLLPDMNRSDVVCTAEGNDLRVGLGFVREWGVEVAERVVEERRRGGPFLSLPDFLRRTPAALKRPAVENMIWVGGFDSLGLTRRELLWQAGLWLGPESDNGRAGAREDHPQLDLQLPEPYADLSFADMADDERMVAEYRMLRFSTALHPLSLLRDSMPAGTIGSERFQETRQGATVSVAGLVVARQRPQTAKGYLFILMEDEYGQINVIVKPEVYEQHRSAVRMEPFLWVRGRLQKDGATTNVIAFEVNALKPRAGDPRKMRAILPSVMEWYAEPQEPLEPTSPPNESGHASAQESAHGWTPRPGPEEPIPGARRASDPFRYLTALHQSPPSVKNFGR